MAPTRTRDENFLTSRQGFVEKPELDYWTRKPSRHWKERLHSAMVFALSFVSVLTTLGIIVVLATETIDFFKSVSLKEFLVGLEWSPLIEPKHFGIVPLVTSTFLIAMTALLMAVPISVVSALFLSEYLRGPWREAIKALIEILAGIPSVVFGFFAVVWVTPQLEHYFSTIDVFNGLSASIVLAVMIIPSVTSLSLDAFLMVPRELREAGYGLGVRRSMVSLTVILPAALSGVVAAIILGFSRAVGETMAVTLAAGATPVLTWNLLQSMQTMTSFIVQVALGDAPAGSIEYQSIFAVGSMLFLITLGANIVARLIVSRFQEVYK